MRGAPRNRRRQELASPSPAGPSAWSNGSPRSTPPRSASPETPRSSRPFCSTSHLARRVSSRLWRAWRRYADPIYSAARASSHLPNAAGPVIAHFVRDVARPPVELEDWPDDDRRSPLVFVTWGLAREPVVQLFASIGAVAAGAPGARASLRPCDNHLTARDRRPKPPPENVPVFFTRGGGGANQAELARCP